MSVLEVMKEALEETLDSGDPTVRSWFMVNSYYYPFLSSLMYVIFVKSFGPYLMRDKKPFDLRTLMIVYNFALVATYGVCLLTFLYLFLTTEAYTKLCSPCAVTDAHWLYVASYAAWILYMVKYIEYADTIFFVLRKKDHLITNLHVIHHASLPIIVWILFRTETSGFQFIPGSINSFIHLIMYTYYGLAAFGPQVQKYLWWKEYLTQLQMLQFVLILFFALVIIPLLGCTTTKHGIYMDIIFGVLFLALFMNFYAKTYKKKPLSRKEKELKNGNAFTNGYSVLSNESSDHTKSTSQNGKIVFQNGTLLQNSEDGFKNSNGQVIGNLPINGDLRKR